MFKTLILSVVMLFSYIGPVEYIQEEQAPVEFWDVFDSKGHDLSTEDINSAVDILMVGTTQSTIVKYIIGCESQYISNAINYNTAVGEDVGLFQINTYYHQERAVELGYNLYKPSDNLKFGKLLLDEQGLQPWAHSKHCWEKLASNIVI